MKRLWSVQVSRCVCVCRMMTWSVGRGGWGGTVVFRCQGVCVSVGRRPVGLPGCHVNLRQRPQHSRNRLRCHQGGKLAWVVSFPAVCCVMCCVMYWVILCCVVLCHVLCHFVSYVVLCCSRHIVHPKRFFLHRQIRWHTSIWTVLKVLILHMAHSGAVILPNQDRSRNRSRN